MVFLNIETRKPWLSFLLLCSTLLLSGCGMRSDSLLYNILERTTGYSMKPDKLMKEGMQDGKSILIYPKTANVAWYDATSRSTKGWSSTPLGDEHRVAIMYSSTYALKSSFTQTNDQSLRNRGKVESAFGEIRVVRTPEEVDVPVWGFVKDEKSPFSSYQVVDYRRESARVYLKIDFSAHILEEPGPITLAIEPHTAYLMPEIQLKVDLMTSNCELTEYKTISFFDAVAESPFKSFALQLVDGFASSGKIDPTYPTAYICPVRSVEILIKPADLEDFLLHANPKHFRGNVLDRLQVIEVEKGDFFNTPHTVIVEEDGTERYIFRGVEESKEQSGDILHYYGVEEGEQLLEEQQENEEFLEGSPVSFSKKE